MYFIVKAKCSGGCRNGGKCEAPETCLCQTGFTGKNCKTGKSLLNHLNRKYFNVPLIKKTYIFIFFARGGFFPSIYFINTIDTKVLRKSRNDS